MPAVAGVAFRCLSEVGTKPFTPGNPAGWLREKGGSAQLETE